jgi:hypothetical protein
MNIEQTPQTVSLLDVLLFVSTEVDESGIQVDSSFDGQTCLVRGDEASVAAALRGVLNNASRSSGGVCKLAATIQCTGKNVKLTVSEQLAGAEWSLQFPEIVPGECEESTGVMRWQ